MKAIKALWRGRDSRGEVYRTFPVGPPGERIKVTFTRDLDGGGTNFGQDYLRLMAAEGLKVDHLLEWCSGPGFIGFSLLAHGFCRRLTLLDVNPLAIDAVRRTVARHGLGERVTVIHSDSLDSAPAEVRWDMVVGNPPHSGTDAHFDWGPDLIYKDPEWDIHRRFFQRIGDHLNPEGLILLQENSDLATPETFREMARENGFRTVHVSACPGYPIFYQGWVRQAAAAPLGPGTLDETASDRP